MSKIFYKISNGYLFIYSKICSRLNYYYLYFIIKKNIDYYYYYCLNFGSHIGSLLFKFYLINKTSMATDVFLNVNYYSRNRRTLGTFKVFYDSSHL